jgi:uncharacterized membrane protein YqiK
MSGQVIGAIVLWLIIAAVIFAVLAYLLRWLYRHSTKETSFVRTGFGGQRVVINGGAFVIPILHNITLVNMNVLQMEVVRERDQALITKDRVRIDIKAEFYVRVSPTRDAVAMAAQTLGQRTVEQERLHALLNGKFVSALRTVAADMTIEEMHERRDGYVRAVKSAAAEALAQNGLELESVAITDLDQTDLEFFNPSNRFDAEGLTKLIEDIEARRKLRNDIEQDSQIKIRQRNLEAEKQALAVDLESESARLAQERAIEFRRAAQRAELARERAMRQTEAEQAEISAREDLEKSRIAHERVLAETRIASEQETQRLEIARRKVIEAAEIVARQEVEQARISNERAVTEARILNEEATRQREIARQKAIEAAEIMSRRDVAEARIASDETTQRREIARKRSIDADEIAAREEVEKARLAHDRSLDALRVEREKLLQALEISKRQAFEEAEIASNEDIERTRIASERGLEEARIIRDREIRQLTIERSLALELAELERTIALAKKSLERSEAQVKAETARARAVEAEELVFTAKETESAKRRKAIDVMIAQREAEVIGIKAEAEKIRVMIEAEGKRMLNEAENLLSDESRASGTRRQLIEKLDSIIRESVKPMEKIKSIKVLHVDGIAGSGSGGGKSVTDEVIDSALRYRVQAPMIDKLMKEVGIEGGSLTRMSDVLRDAKDLKSLSRPEAGRRNKAEDDDRDR